MRRILIAAAVTLAFAQPATSQFAGTWTAALNGKTYVRLELAHTNGALTGRIGLADIHVDGSGVVDTVMSDVPGFTPIFDVRLRDGLLAFARKDGDDVDRFEMRLVNEGAELLFAPSAADREALAREGVPLPKPIRLAKTPR